MLDSWKQLKFLPRYIWILSFAIFFQRMGAMILPFLVLYLSRNKGFSTIYAGIFLAIYGLVSFMVSPIAGRLSDKYPNFLLFQICLWGSAISSTLFTVTRSHLVLLIIVIINAIFTEAIRPMVFSYVAKRSNQAEARTNFACLRLFVNLGFGVGPILGSLLISINFDWIFFLNSGFTIVSSAILLKLNQTETELKIDPEEATQNSTLVSTKGFVFFCVGIFLSSFVYFQHESVLSLFVIEHLKMPDIYFGLIFSINTCLIIVFEIPLLYRLKNIGSVFLLVLGSTLLCLGFGLNFFAEQFWQIAILTVIWTVGEILLFPISLSFISDSFPKTVQGKYMGYYSMVFGLSSAFSPWLCTMIIENFSYKAPWILSLAILPVCILSFTFIRFNIYKGKDSIQRNPKEPLHP